MAAALLCFVALSLAAVPLDGALTLKLGSGKEDCVSVLSRNQDLSQDYSKADELRYGGIFDGYYNSVVKLRFRNGKLCLISVELLPGNPRDAFEEIERKVTAKYQVSPTLDEEVQRASWSFDDSRRIELRQQNAMVYLDYTDDALAGADEDTSGIY